MVGTGRGAQLGILIKGPEVLESTREIDTIVLKCLRKEPDRRYQSAGELARDLRRYLAGEPIDAKRDSTVYMLRKAVAYPRASASGTSPVIVRMDPRMSKSITVPRLRLKSASTVPRVSSPTRISACITGSSSWGAAWRNAWRSAIDPAI